MTDQINTDFRKRLEQFNEYQQGVVQVLDKWERVYEALGSPGEWGCSKAEAALRRVKELTAAPQPTPTAPQEGQIVIVACGVAQYRGGVFYTGMEAPQWERPIKWDVTWWRPLPVTEPPQWE
jgi:hypothetical protein